MKKGNNKVCMICEASFYVKPYRLATARFCSSKCAGIYGGHRVVNRRNLFQIGHQTNLGKKLPTAGFPKGNVPWNLGKNASEEVRQKLSLAHMGQTAWNKGMGNRNKFHNLHDYQIWRKSIYKRDDYTCQICFSRGVKLNAHHIFPISIFPEKVFDLENGKTVCWPCHAKTESYGMTAISKRRELQERLSKLTCSEAWEETLKNVQRLEAEAKEKIYADKASTSALASILEVRHSPNCMATCR